MIGKILNYFWIEKNDWKKSIEIENHLVIKQILNNLILILFGV